MIHKAISFYKAYRNKKFTQRNGFRATRRYTKIHIEVHVCKYH